MIFFFITNLFISAFLVFSVQPLLAKMILPYLGGTASVWNTSMLFFQIGLLLGYLYAHLSSQYLKPKLQIVIHIALLIAGIFFLPISVYHPNFIDSNTSPIMWQLVLMISSIGVPYIFLCGTAPLVQRWFFHCNSSKATDPYFLYATSNLGSLFGLLSYPFLNRDLSKNCLLKLSIGLFYIHY